MAEFRDGVWWCKVTMPAGEVEMMRRLVRRAQSGTGWLLEPTGADVRLLDVMDARLGADLPRDR